MDNILNWCAKDAQWFNLHI